MFTLKNKTKTHRHLVYNASNQRATCNPEKQMCCSKYLALALLHISQKEIKIFLNYFKRIVHASSQHWHHTKCSGWTLFPQAALEELGLLAWFHLSWWNQNRTWSGPKVLRTGNTTSTIISPKPNSHSLLLCCQELGSSLKRTSSKSWQESPFFKCILILQEWPELFSDNGFCKLLVSCLTYFLFTLHGMLSRYQTIGFTAWNNKQSNTPWYFKVTLDYCISLFISFLKDNIIYLFVNYSEIYCQKVLRKD